MPQANASEFGIPQDKGEGFFVITYKQALKALRAAKEVYVQPRLGTVEMDIRISKAQARQLLDAAEDATATEIDNYGSYYPQSGCFYIG